MVRFMQTSQSQFVLNETFGIEALCEFRISAAETKLNRQPVPRAIGTDFGSSPSFAPTTVTTGLRASRPLRGGTFLPLRDLSYNSRESTARSRGFSAPRAGIANSLQCSYTPR